MLYIKLFVIKLNFNILFLNFFYDFLTCYGTTNILMYNMSMFHILLLNEKIKMGIGKLGGGGVGWGGGGDTLTFL